MLTKPFKPLALAFLVNLIISVEDKIKYKVIKVITVQLLMVLGYILQFILRITFLV